MEESTALEILRVLSEMQTADKATSDEITDIKESFYYTEVITDDYGQILSEKDIPYLMTVKDTLETMNENLENINVTLQFGFGLALILCTVFILIKTFFTGW